MKEQFLTMKNRLNSKTRIKESNESLESKQAELAIIYKRIEAFQFNEAIKLLTTFRAKYNDEIKYQYLNYHLVSIVQSNEARLKRLVLAAQLLTSSDFIKMDVSLIERIWQDNQSLLTKLSASHLKLIAFKLCESSDLSSAENILEYLLQHAPKQSNVVLLQRIAKRFAELNIQDKRVKYLKLAHAYLMTGA